MLFEEFPAFKYQFPAFRKILVGGYLSHFKSDLYAVKGKVCVIIEYKKMVLVHAI